MISSLPPILLRQDSFINVEDGAKIFYKGEHLSKQNGRAYKITNIEGGIGDEVSIEDGEVVWVFGDQGPLSVWGVLQDAFRRAQSSYEHILIEAEDDEQIASWSFADDTYRITLADGQHVDLELYNYTSFKQLAKVTSQLLKEMEKRMSGDDNEDSGPDVNDVIDALLT